MERRNGLDECVSEWMDRTVLRMNRRGSQLCLGKIGAGSQTLVGSRMSHREGTGFSCPKMQGCGPWLAHL